MARPVSPSTTAFLPRPHHLEAWPQDDRHRNPTISFDIPSDRMSAFSDLSPSNSPPPPATKLFKPFNARTPRDQPSSGRGSPTSLLTQSSHSTPAAPTEPSQLAVTVAAFSLPIPKSVPSVRLTAAALYDDGTGLREIGRTESMLLLTKNNAVTRAQWTQTIPVSLQTGDRELITIRVAATPAAARDSRSGAAKARQRKQVYYGETEVMVSGPGIQNASLYSRTSAIKMGSITVFIEDHDAKGEDGQVEFSMRAQEIKPRPGSHNHLCDQYFEVQKLAGGTIREYWIPVYRSEIMRKKDASGFVHFDPFVISCQRLNGRLPNTKIRIASFRASAATGSSEVMGVAKISQAEVEQAINNKMPIHWKMTSHNPSTRLELHLSRSSKLASTMGNTRFSFELLNSTNSSARPKPALTRTHSFAQFPRPSSMRTSNEARDEFPFAPDANIAGPTYKRHSILGVFERQS